MTPQTSTQVLGNEKRLGAVARKWTVEAQVKRDPSVMALAKVMQSFDNLVTGIDSKKSYVNYSDGALQATVIKGGDGRAHVTRLSGGGAAETEGVRPGDVVVDFDGVPVDYDKFMAAHERATLDPCEFGARGHRVGFARNEDALKLVAAHYSAVKTELKATCAALAASMIADARVVLCTVATASRSLLVESAFAPAVCRVTTAVLDEAGTAAEPNLPLLLLLPRLKRIVAIGDQKQLAPFTNLQPDAGSPGQCFKFQKTGRCPFGARCRFEHEAATARLRGEEPLGFFQRLEKALPADSVPCLRDQYRMHPAIAGYVSAAFYEGALRTPRDVAAGRERADAEGMHWLAYVPGPRGGEASPTARGSRRTSKINDTEARLCFEVVAAQPRAKKSVMVRNRAPRRPTGVNAVCPRR